MQTDSSDRPARLSLSAETPRPSVCVFGPCLYLTVTIEHNRDDRFSDIHLHPGGQAFWIARMLQHLGETPVLVSPLGGETGRVIEGLAPAWGVDLTRVETHDDSPAYVHDRRSGERCEVAASKFPRLDRHELDDLYNEVLQHAVMAGTAVITGRQEGHDFPLEAFRRLGADLDAMGVTVLGDLHGAELDAFLDGGPLHLLKVSDEELMNDGVLTKDASREERVSVLAKLVEMGARGAVISSSDHPTVSFLGGDYWSAVPRHLEPADPRGSGDSMAAGLVVAVRRGLDPGDTLRLACAAGAANVTRHGLGNVKPGLVEALTAHVEVHKL